MWINVSYIKQLEKGFKMPIRAVIHMDHPSSDQTKYSWCRLKEYNKHLDHPELECWWDLDVPLFAACQILSFESSVDIPGWSSIQESCLKRIFFPRNLQFSPSHKNYRLIDGQQDPLKLFMPCQVCFWHFKASEVCIGSSKPLPDSSGLIPIHSSQAYRMPD